MTPEQELYRANRAKEILENEVYIEAFEAIDKELTEQWKSSPARDTEGRERIWLMQALLGKLKISLESTMASGKLAVAELKHKQSVADRLRSFIS